MSNPAVVEKKEDKVEKRRALGRGLESLLPGPRVVAPGGEPRVPSREQGAGTGAQDSGGGEQQVPHRTFSPVRNDTGQEGGAETAAAAEMETTRAGAPSAVAQGGSAPHEREVISIEAQAAGPQQAIPNLAVELIDKNPYQTRYVFDEETLNELADSIRENGVVQPVVVRPSENAGRYVLVLGERRLRATKMAGQRTIPAIVRRLSLQQAAEMTVLENVQRTDLNPLEQAEAFRVLSKEFNLTQAQIAERIGVSRETVANYMRLLRLPEEVMKYLLDGRLSFTDAREILALDKEEHIRIVAREVVTKHLKWDEIEQRVRELNGFVGMLPTESKKAGRARWMDPNVRAAQTDMERTLGLRVRIKDRNGRGSILIDYNSVDEYERVVELLRRK